MARIPAVEIERLKSEISLERLIEAAGIELKKAGVDLIGKCPFHDDREPSLVISPRKNLWHCLGACQAGGSVIDWVMRMQRVSFRHAVELLRNDPSLAAAARPAAPSARVRKLPAPVAPDADDQALLNQVIDYYHETLKQSPEALAYLKARGIDHPEVVERFKLGFANRTLGLRLPEKTRKAGAEIRKRLTRLGLYRDTGREHFNGSLVIPVLDEQGNVTEVYGRKVTPNLRPGTPLHLYLPGPHKGVWNVEALAASKEIILCEALIDALTFWCAGYRNVTAAYGVEGFTDDHVSAFKQHGTERVLIAYDRDAAGENACVKLAEKLIAEGIEAWRIEFPKGMDANEYALKVTPAAKSLGVAIRKALWLGRGKPRGAIETVPVIELPIASSSVPSLAAKEETIEPALVLPATPAPAAPAADVEAQVKDAEIVLTFGDRRYRVRGFAKNLSYDVMKVNVLVAKGEAFFVDTLDLYAARARAAYIAQAAVELMVPEDVVKTDLGKVLLKLEALQEENIKRALEPKQPAAVVIDAAEREAALALLRDPRLLDRLLADFETIGIVGERTNKLVAYLAAVSRKLDSPLAVVLQSSSAAGKSSLMDAVLSLMPEEERVKYSAMTGQSLFYMGETNLKNKILAIVEEEGASRASYALKLLQSEGELRIASTGKDPATGNLVTHEYRVEGPVMIFLTTTAIEIDEELLNRCLVLSIDEGRTQTQAIHRLQRERRTLAGLIARAERADILTVHRNAQRLLRALAVLNPYARSLTFPDEATRTRRDHEKYLTLIDAIALLHQYQREVKTTTRADRAIEYVEVTLDDIALANELAHEVLGRSLDELPPQTRRLLMLVDTFVAERAKAQAVKRSEIRFSRRELRESLGWGDTQLKIHLARLAELEYVITRRNGQHFIYELVYDGQGKDGKPFVPNLIDIERLKHTYDAERSGLNGARSALGRGAVGARSGGGRDSKNAGTPHGTGVADELTPLAAEMQYSDDAPEIVSYPQIPLAAHAA
jgi:DNA primase